uniref:Uncharacterized protein n=1 Tax=Anguilla anguilla TaxID=7936 RepID=A0A0E9RL93_ANGAN
MHAGQQKVYLCAFTKLYWWSQNCAFKEIVRLQLRLEKAHSYREL